MTDAYIFDHVRSPRGKGKSDGSLHQVTPIELLTQVLESLRDRNDLDTSRIDDVIMGVVHSQGEQGSNPARVAAINAGYAEEAAGKQLNRFCASGLEAVNSGAAQVMSGMSDLCIGGGLESMSRVSMNSVGGALGVDPQVAYSNYIVPQGISADLIASKYGFSRDDVDAYAVESQKRASHARDEGYFDNSIVPIKDNLGEVLLDHDECIRTGTSMEDLAKLNPAFIQMGQFGFNSVAIQRYPEVEKIEHVHHAGNSSVIVDGASAVLVGTKEIGEELGLTPRARIVGFASIGSEPTIMLTGPAPSAEKALKRCGMNKDDIDLFELNEAFAVVVLLYMQQMDIDHEQINVNGGAIAMGHPLGATGGMVLGTLIDEMERRDLNTGLVNLCIGGGMGTSTIVERA
jgi:acetyl-CoA C-acetyltransferase